MDKEYIIVPLRNLHSNLLIVYDLKVNTLNWTGTCTVFFCMEVTFEKIRFDKFLIQK